MEAVDDATANLILQLQLEDIEESLRDTTNPVVTARLNNRAAALRVQHQEIVIFNRCHPGRHAQRGAGRAVFAERVEIAVVPQEESTVPDAAAEPQPDATTDQRALSEDERDENFVDCVERQEEASPSNATQSLILNEEPRRRMCYICLADHEHTQTTEVGDCSHVWCRTCLQQVFDLAAKNESNYPIRCCEATPAIALDHVGVVALLGTDLILAVQARLVEYATKNRIYCHDPRCSSFIAPDAINERQATCAECHKITCMRCKEDFHEGECKAKSDKDESENQNEKSFEKWQTDNGTATCRTCHRVIIISHGCNHMRWVDSFLMMQIVY